MGTKLTTPLTQPDLLYQAITEVLFSVPHKRNPTETDYVFDLDNVFIRYTVSTVDSNFFIVDQQKQSGLWTNLPTAVKNALKDLYPLLEADAESRGLIGPGTDETLP